jgi:energy-converting hydrogenase Eha subunit C
VNKLIHLALLGVLGLVVLAATSRALTALAGALVAPIVVCGIVVALLRCVWWLTGPR